MLAYLRLSKQENNPRPIRLGDFKGNTKPDLVRFHKAYTMKNAVPLGFDINTGEIASLTDNARTGHFLCVGVTGSGKSTLMFNLILHAIKHSRPLVIIDPKGSNQFIDKLQKVGPSIHPKFEDRFKLFSLSLTERSCFYNPLKHGNSTQIKDKIVGSLNWSENFYRDQAANFLTQYTAAKELLGDEVTFRDLSRVLLFREAQSELLARLQKCFNSESNTQIQAHMIHERLSSYFTKAKNQELSGLASQISILDNLNFGSLLSFKRGHSTREIDFREVIAQNQIAYFHMDTLGHEDSGRRLGRVILQDLKALASDILRGLVANPRDEKFFFPIFIDEFGAFASVDFIEFLKQCREAGFSNHMFCQGLEDLDVVSPEFRRQVVSASRTKMGLLMYDSSTVDEFCATAGTFDAVEQSHQVEGRWLKQKTGMGNLRETKQMMIEHDVFKNLKLGEAVMIEKSPSRIRALRFPMLNG
jgi:hypothetical protein